MDQILQTLNHLVTLYLVYKIGEDVIGFCCVGILFYGAYKMFQKILED